MVVSGAPREPKEKRLSFSKKKQRPSLRNYLVNLRKPRDPLPSRRILGYPVAPCDLLHLVNARDDSCGKADVAPSVANGKHGFLSQGGWKVK